MSSREAVPTTKRPDSAELRDGYAEVGDVRLHYVEAGDGPLVVLLHGFPEFWYGWRQQIAPLAAAGFRVVAPDLRGYNLSSKPDGVAAYGADKLAADVRGLIQERGAESALVVGHDWGGTVAWTLAMNHPEVVDRLAILNAAHPRKLNEGLRNPSQLRRSWYFFYFQLPDLPERHVQADDWEFFQDFLRDAQPPYTPEEIEALRRGVVAARRGHGDDRLLPLRGATLVRRDPAHHGAHPRHLGRARPLPRPDARRAPPRRRAQPRPRRAPARRLALGPPRRGRARQRTCSSTSSPRPAEAPGRAGSSPRVLGLPRVTIATLPGHHDTSDRYGNRTFEGPQPACRARTALVCEPLGRGQGIAAGEPRHRQVFVVEGHAARIALQHRVETMRERLSRPSGGS